MKRNLFILLAVFVLGGLMSFGLVQLFELRFQSGDIYPAYSSSRADPKGTKILYQSLEHISGIEVVRQIKPLPEYAQEHEVVLMAGCNFRSDLSDLDETLDPFLKSGGRAVIAFKSVEATHRKRHLKKKDSADESNEKSVDVEESEVEIVEPVKKTDECWTLDFERFTRAELKEEDPEEFAFSQVEGLDPVAWTSALFFDDLGDDWAVLYTFLDKPVVIERSRGKGSVVLMADSYLFSNEAMVKDRHTAALLHVFGNAERILFDELHLGVKSKEGIMMLVHRYHLTGVLLACLLVTGLFVWKRSSGFIPNYTDPNDAGNQVGLSVESSQGFTNLLVRHIPQKDLLRTMLQEWSETFSRQAMMNKKITQANIEFRKLEASEKKRNPVEMYNQILQLLKERK